MTPHLRDDEIAEALDATLAPPRLEHVRGCAACRSIVADARATLDALGSDEVPEPSPPFRAHAAARIRQAVAAEPPARAWSARRLAWVTGGIGLAAVSLALLVVEGDDRRGRVADGVVPPGVEAIDAGTAVVENGSWDLVAALGADLDLDAAAQSGLLPDDGLSDRALLALDADERSELAALLERALRRQENGS
jgi:hypothetical protein